MSDIPDRPESPAMRADRNWTELTQELRVSQTGVQILTAFLLILPFQQRFAELIKGTQLTLYLVLVSLAITTTILMVAPVSLHRFLFQRGRKARTVHISNRLTTLALVFLGLTIAGTVAFVFSVVLGQFWGWIAAAAAAVLLAALWLVLPWLARTTRDPHEEG
ncbi:DUF6328 family protein [Leucobacter denitrificans]|uniref:Sodium:proton antiporter n=1 Tax=Leucobacter denitrificans TaxID=683042 RepID=A0A7G9S509_9MICO|nr:DUF6328 family protein [Leucobacter denitrificans]QNN62934.1 sodium:proton antiporter [Leucobacter denitrificans]